MSSMCVVVEGLPPEEIPVGCSVTFANVEGSARLKPDSKNTGGTDSSGGIARRLWTGVVMRDALRDDDEDDV